MPSMPLKVTKQPRALRVTLNVEYACCTILQPMSMCVRQYRLFTVQYRTVLYSVFNVRIISLSGHGPVCIVRRDEGCLYTHTHTHTHSKQYMHMCVCRINFKVKCLNVHISHWFVFLSLECKRTPLFRSLKIGKKKFSYTRVYTVYIYLSQTEVHIIMFLYFYNEVVFRYIAVYLLMS